MKGNAQIVIVGLVATLTFVGGVYVFGFRPQGRAGESPPSATPSATAAEDQAERNYQQGVKAEEGNDHALAASYYSESLRGRPDHVETLLKRSHALWLTKDCEGARRDAKRVMELTHDPKSVRKK
jgi:hypothetical protein